MIKFSIIRFRKYLSWINISSKGIKPHLIIGTIFGILKVFVGLLFILVSKHMVDIATGDVAGSILRETIILAILFIFELLLNIINSFLYTQAENLMRNNLRQRLFDHLLISPIYKRGSYHSGDLTARLEEDVRIVTSNITTSFPTVLIITTQLIGALWILIQFDRRLAWILVMILPIFMVIGKLLSKRLRKMTEVIRDYESKVQSQIQEGLQQASILRALEAEKYASKKLETLQKNVYQHIMKRLKFTLTSKSTLSIGFTCGYMVAFVWGCFSLHEGSITFGIMTAFLQLVGQIQRPTVGLAQIIPGFIHASTSIDRLLEIENIKTEEIFPQKKLLFASGIKFQNVSYSYPGESQNIYQSFCHDFTPGSHTAILGHTGRGKTTLFRLILSLLKPTEGSIKIYDKYESLEISTGTRCNISYVPQGNTLFSGTIRENLLLSYPHATEKEIADALHTAVADFVYDLPDGLNTMCGEQGTGLSEGQAQRIAIARGLLKPANILLLDEISASLDQETEKILFNRLMNFSPNKTIILITHRTEAAEYCDNILRV
ncbi:ABC transporter ATP-binding protein [Bacteroides sp. ET336]|uniref:ABC transporter ATP-binding protein n=1 Tax=Bacteroides sp. ET336 TaxID=2972459 RepID=UPI0021AD14AC|nr:ABC transporter ATP-binding protein [Bacteroides sp. ET336]MCR8893797.1 ABC transporter ATP-binding protein/permease [Bacteroides sp. ET336]MDN0058294.1 ABC transporter ATP-binding protein [Bacteroides caecigallinarum]